MKTVKSNKNVNFAVNDVFYLKVLIIANHYIFKFERSQKLKMEGEFNFVLFWWFPEKIVEFGHAT